LPAGRIASSCFFVVRPPPSSTLFPYTTLFRSWLVAALVVSTAISAYAYLRVVLAAFRTAGAAVVAAAGSSVGVASGEAVAGAEEESGEWSFAWADIGLGVVFALTVAGVLALGLLPETFLPALEGLLPPR